MESGDRLVALAAIDVDNAGVGMMAKTRRSKITAPADGDNQMTGIDLAREFFPDRSDSDLDDLLWEHTCYPFGTPDQVRRHLRRFKWALQRKRWVCMRCTHTFPDPAPVGDLCARCAKAFVTVNEALERSKRHFMKALEMMGQ